MFVSSTRLQVALMVALLGVPQASAQTSPPPSSPAARAAGLPARELAPLVKAVDRAIAASQPGSEASVAFEWQERGAAFAADPMQGVPFSWTFAQLKSAVRKVYIPFVLGADPKLVPSQAVSVYLRVVDATGASVYEQDFAGQFRPGGAAQESRLSRAIAVAPGEYRVYAALRFDRSQVARRDASVPAGTTAAAAATTTDLVHVASKELTVEDLWSPNLTTSTVFVADRLEVLKAPLTPQALAERPFVVGAAEIVPSYDQAFRKTEELTVFFQVYNAVLGSDQKPSVSVDYVFERVEGEVAAPFKRVPTQSFTAQTLPPAFDAGAGHQLSAGWSVPLASFPVGDYRLVVTIADKLAGTAVTRSVAFTVEGT